MREAPLMRPETAIPATARPKAQKRRLFWLLMAPTARKRVVSA
jgi:hypothetical protein